MHRPDLSKPRFLFDAQAIPFSARLTSPVAAEIDPAGATVCSPVGGLVCNRAENISYKGVISVGAAYSQISAAWHPEEKEFNTVVLSVVERVNILNIFTIDRAVAAMTVKRSGVLDGGKAINSLNLIDYTGSYFEGIRVAGKEVRVQLRPDVYGEKGSGILLKDSAGRLKFAQDLISCGGVKSEITSLVANSEIPAEFSVQGRNNVINVPGFGRFTLAPVAVTAESQYLNMFCFELGCGNEGDGSGGAARGNGMTDWPP